MKKKNGYIYYNYEKKTEKDILSETVWKSIFRWLAVLTAVFIVAITAVAVCFRVVSVDGESMIPTLNDNDCLLVYTFDYEPKMGDIVLISGESDEEPIVKRVIAFEHQVVEISYKTGIITVDGKELPAELSFELTKRSANEIAYPFTVPEGHIFVLGDNRDESYDSRSRSFGTIDANRVVGKVLGRVYPVSQWNIYG